MIATVAVVLFQGAPRADAAIPALNMKAAGFKLQAYQNGVGSCSLRLSTNGAVHGRQWKAAVRQAAENTVAGVVLFGDFNGSAEAGAFVRYSCDEHPNRGRQLLGSTALFVVGSMVAIVVSSAIAIFLGPILTAAIPASAPVIAAIVGCLAGSLSGIAFGALLKAPPRNIAIGAGLNCVGGALAGAGAEWNAARALAARGALRNAGISGELNAATTMGGNVAEEAFDSARSAFSDNGVGIIEMVTQGNIQQPVRQALSRAFS